jgi:HEAT repeat protein
MTPAQLTARERIRPEVESIVAELNAPTGSPPGLLQKATSRLVALGPDVVPFMVAELDYPTAYTFHVAACVLGTLGGPEAVQALHKAVERSEGYPTKFGEGQKAYAITGLALAGERDALRLVEDGRWAGSFALLEDTSLVELVGLLTAPDSVPILLEWLALDPADEGNVKRLKYAMRALGRIADPAAAERIVPLLESESWEVRREAVTALGALGSFATADVLLAALDDPSPEVAYEAAKALEASIPPSKVPAIQARLTTEQNSVQRQLLYRALAAAGGASQIPALAKNWGRDDPLDRLQIVRSVAALEDPGGFDLLRNALDDPHGTVILTASEGLAALDTSEARKALLAQLAKPNWNAASHAVPALVALDEAKAGPVIAHQLLEVELAAPITDPLRSDDIAALGDALVALSYTQALPALLEATPKQTNPAIVTELDRLARRLTAIDARGNDVAAWSEALGSSDVEMRLLAVDRLGRAGGSAAIAALSAAFEGAAEAERLAILDALGKTGSPKALPLLERLLMDPEFDTYPTRRLRSTAAWAARRIGGKQAVDLLRRSVQRREGLDMDVLVYLAVLEGKDATSDLERYRISRLRDLWGQRGLEQARINVMLHALAQGHTLAFLDKPPSAIHLGQWE